MPATRVLFVASAHWAVLARSAALLACAATAHAALDPTTDRAVGGVFSNACGDRSQVMIRLYGDTLDIERGSVAVKANRLQVSKTPPPGAPLPGFKAQVRGQVRGSDNLTVVLTHDAQGLFARIDGSLPALAPLGPGVVGTKVRHCDPNRNALPGAPAAPARPVAPSELLGDPRFKSAYAKAIGPLARERWIARLDGPAPVLREVPFGPASYTLAASCKPHDCSDHNLVLLWNAAQDRLIGLVHQRGTSTLLGAPAPAEAQQLQRLWAAEWRSR